MEQTGVTALISKWEFTMGKEGTLNRLRAMRDYAEKCLKEHPREKCAGIGYMLNINRLQKV